MATSAHRPVTRGRRAHRYVLGVVVVVMGLAGVAPAVVAGPRDAGGDVDVEVVASFDAAAGELPEGVAFDRRGTAYVSLGPPFFAGGGYGEIRSIDPWGRQRTLATFPDGPAPAGLAVHGRTVYAAIPDPLGTNAGILRIDRNGDVTRIDGTETMKVPNGLATTARGTLYATDSVLGQVWRLRPGESTASPWLSHELLAGCVPGQLGANGIVVRGRWVHVANSDRGLLLRVPILHNGEAGEPRIVAGDRDCDQTDELWSMDGIALDWRGRVHATLVIQNRLVRIDRDGSVKTLLTADDGLWNPASLAFGTGWRWGRLFVTNYAVLDPVPPANLGPALLEVDTHRWTWGNG